MFHSQRECAKCARTCAATQAPYDEPVMPKRTVRDYRSMTIQELRATARDAHRREDSAPYAKGRRAWKSVWVAAEHEIARRESLQE